MFDRFDRACVTAFLAHCAAHSYSVIIIDRDEPEALTLTNLESDADELMACDEAVARVDSQDGKMRARFLFVFGNGDEEAIYAISDFTDNDFGRGVFRAVSTALTLSFS